MNRGSFLAVLLAVLNVTPRASAFCRATTCDPADPSQGCTLDPATECLTSGAPLFWASSCLSISVQADGAPRAGIDYAAAEGSVQRAFDAWTSVTCDGQPPSLRVKVSGPVACATSEYSRDHRNANIVMFRENEWPYEGAEDALGLTRLRFDLDQTPGAIWDADVEINAVSEPLGMGTPKPDEVDLDSLLTHEAGHVLGLAHTLDVAATMRAGYETGSVALRTLAADDIAGVCASYPPERKTTSSSCEPRHGFSELCGAEQPANMGPVDDPGAEDEVTDSGGCSTTARHSRQGGPLATSVLSLVCAGVLLLRRKRLAGA